MRMTAAMFTAAVALTALGLAVSAAGATKSTWYWTPGACKSELQTHGVLIGDGRHFYVAKAFCVGYHNHCWANNGLRRYKVFATVMRSYDGVVRTMVMTVTGHDTWRGSPLKIVSNYMSPDDFNNQYGPAAWAVATVENRGGCFDVHP